MSSLSGAWPIQVKPENGHHLTVEDVNREAVMDEDVHHAPTRLVSLENTLNGTILPLKDAQAIASWARSNNMKMHLDGARLWEAVSAGAGSLKDYCQCFDSASLCFSKGLGAPIGSMIVGSAPFVARARHIRKSLGGGLRQSGVVTAPARVAVDETFLGGKLAESHEIAKRVARMWVDRGGRVKHRPESNMVWLDLDDAGVGEEWVEEGVREGVKVGGGRVVCHYQIGEEGVRALGRVMDTVLKGKGKGKRKTINGEEEEIREEVKKVASEVAAPEME